MTRDEIRENIPDPESAPAVPIPSGVESGVPGDRSSVASSEPLTERAPAYAIALSAILPGSGHAVIGEALRGLLLIIPWGVLLGLANGCDSSFSSRSTDTS
jgi:hypothetical protein